MSEQLGVTILPSGVPKKFSLANLVDVVTDEPQQEQELYRAQTLAGIVGVEPAAARVVRRHFERQEAHLYDEAGLPLINSVVFVPLPEA